VEEVAAVGAAPGADVELEQNDGSLDYVEARLERAFARRAVLPRHAVQYRLCEVGRHRLDPRELTRGVQTLVNAGRGVREVVSGIYVDPELDEHDAGHCADEALGVVGRVAAGVNGGVLGNLVAAAASTVAVTGEAGDHLTEVAPTYLAADVVLPRPSTLLRADGGLAGRILLWVTHELPWLYPDDPRLWGALRAAHLDGAHLAVFARKIAPATFAVFKALGVRGTQYYAMLVDAAAHASLPDTAASVGWAPVRRPADLHGSPALQQLGASVAALAAGDARADRATDVGQTVRSAIARIRHSRRCHAGGAPRVGRRRGAGHAGRVARRRRPVGTWTGVRAPHSCDDARLGDPARRPERAGRGFGAGPGLRRSGPAGDR